MCTLRAPLILVPSFYEAKKSLETRLFPLSDRHHVGIGGKPDKNICALSSYLFPASLPNSFFAHTDVGGGYPVEFRRACLRFASLR